MGGGLGYARFGFHNLFLKYYVIIKLCYQTVRGNEL